MRRRTGYRRETRGMRRSRLLALLVLLVPTLVLASAPAARAADVTGIDVHLPWGRVVTGRLLAPGGAPIWGARISMTVPGTIQVLSTTSRADGRFQLQQIPAGEHQVRIEPRSTSPYVKAGFIADVRTVRRLDMGDMTLEVGTKLSGNVKSSTGANLAGVRVTVACGSQCLEQSAVTNVSGNFTIAGLGSGRNVTLAFEPPADAAAAAGYYSTATPGRSTPRVDDATFFTVPTSNLGGFNVRLPAGRAITGHFDSPYPAGTTIQVRVIPERPEQIGTKAMVVPGSGDFAVLGLRDGPYRLRFVATPSSTASTRFYTPFAYCATCPGRAEWYAIRDDAEVVTLDGADVALPPVSPTTTTISGTVVNGAGAGVPGMFVGHNTFVGPADPHARTGTDGSFTLDGLVPHVTLLSVRSELFGGPIRDHGPYQDGWYRDDAPRFFTTSINAATLIDTRAGDQTIHMTVPVGATLSGRITYGANQPVEGALVRCNEYGPAAHTGADGRYTLRGLGPGPCILLIGGIPPHLDLVAGYYSAMAMAPGQHWTFTRKKATPIQVTLP